jgi:hypothetical protein
MSVKVLRSSPPVFPKCCVVCRDPRPDGKVRFRASPGSYWGIIEPLLDIIPLVDIYHADIPTCANCRTPLWAWRWVRAVALIATGAAAFAATMYLVPKGWPPVTQRLTAVGLVFLFVVPYAVWQMVSPLAVDLDVDEDWAEFNFSDPLYAEEFFSLNRRTAKRS